MRVMQNTCTVHGRDIKTQYIWVDINLAIQKGLTFYQTRSNAFLLSETHPAYYTPKVVRMETGEVLYKESVHVTSASTNDLFEKRVEKRIGFRTRSTIRSWSTI